VRAESIEWVRGGLRHALLAAVFGCTALLSMPASAQPAQPAADPGLAATVADDPALESDVLELSHKLRCLVCQNQSIAESNAPLAVDLRNQVREQLAAGNSKAEVVDYLVARYGDFVLYEPPFKATTVVLWAGPAVLLFGGAGWLAFRLRRRADEAIAEEGLSDAERDRARALLSGADAAAPTTDSRESRS
jgi:cytochrome c-type biogenesis protein CcmH